MKTLILTGGGSAGHVTPCLALLPQLREEFTLAYIGTDGIERGMLAGAGIPYYTIACPKLVRGALLKNVDLPFRFAAAVRQAKRALRDAHADGVFCAGGYVSLPVAAAAHGLGLPVLSHESDSTPGLANRLIARHAAYMTASFSAAAASLKHGVHTGAPLRKELFGADRGAARKKDGFAAAQKFCGDAGGIRLAADRIVQEITLPFRKERKGEQVFKDRRIHRRPVCRGAQRLHLPSEFAFILHIHAPRARRRG